MTMCRLRWFFIFLVLSLASLQLASSLPLPSNETADPPDPRAIILKEQEVDAHNISVKGSLKKRQWGMFSEPGHVDETYIILINASPYEWERGYIHEYQMPDWEKDFPELIKPGNSVSILIQPSKTHGNWGDSAAEVVYNLVGTSKPMSFMVRFGNRGASSLKVEFLEGLFSMNNAMGSVHDLEITKFPGGSAFILAGEEGEFITNDPPIGWMQAMLPELKDKPLREIVLGRSHHSGLWSDHRGIGYATAANSQAQSVHLREQLGNGGIRILDFRAYWRKGEFREIHGAQLNDGFSGLEGASLGEMIETVNEFNRKYPGELIIWDIHGDDAWNGDHGSRRLDQQDRIALYKQFLTLENRVSIPDDVNDVSKWPLDRFIGNKTSAVLINFDERWRKMDLDVFPSSTDGFVTGRNLPLTHPWSNTNDIHKLVEQQVANFRGIRPVPQNRIYVAEWILTLQGLQLAFPVVNILTMAHVAWRSLFEDLWPLTTSDSYPNWVSVDNVRGNQHKTLVMTMNHCLVAKKCGDLGGKVT